MKNASPWQSLQWKLPALMGALLLLVASSLTFLSYRSLERTLVDGAMDRLSAAAGLLGDAIQPGFARRAGVLEQLASRPEIRGLLVDPRRDRPAAEAALRGMLAPGAALEVRSADGTCLMGLSRTGSALVRGDECVGWPPIAVTAVGALPIRVVGDSASMGMAAPLAAPGADSAMAPAGYLLETRSLSPASGIQLIEGLIGSSSQLFLANADGSVWTDLSKVVPAAHALPLTDGARLEYAREGEGRLAVTKALAGTPLVVAVEFRRSAVLAPAATFLRRTELTALLILLLGLAVAWGVSHRIALPLREATAAAEAVAAGSHAQRIEVGGRDEVGRLAAAFNVMADEVEKSRHELEVRVERRTQLLKETVRQLRDAQGELVRKEKLATLGQLASSVGHELRNPLGVMSNAVYFLKMVLKDPQTTVAEYLDILKHQITLSEKIISDLLDFSRVKTPQAESVAVRDLVDAQLERVGRPSGIEIAIAIPPDLPLVRTSGGRGAGSPPGRAGAGGRRARDQACEPGGRCYPL